MAHHEYRHYPVSPSYPALPGAFQAGIFGMLVVSGATLGDNLHHVGEGHMTLGQAAGHAAASGLTGGVAAAAATATASRLTDGGEAGLAVTLAAAIGVSYLINQIIK